MKEHFYSWLADRLPRRVVFHATARLLGEGARFHSRTSDCDKTMTAAQALAYWNWNSK